MSGGRFVGSVDTGPISPLPDPMVVPPFSFAGTLFVKMSGIYVFYRPVTIRRFHATLVFTGTPTSTITTIQIFNNASLVTDLGYPPVQGDPTLKFGANSYEVWSNGIWQFAVGDKLQMYILAADDNASSLTVQPILDPTGLH